jgi:uncharacterized protein YdiU (UPF0061 family)
MTIFFRNLSSFTKNTSPKEALELVHDSFYSPEELQGTVLKKWTDWFHAYLYRLQKETATDTIRKEKMNLFNPKYVLRNYMSQLAIDAADKGNYLLIDELFNLLKKPYDEQEDMKKWFVKRPDWARHKVGCSMLSCSS